MFTILFVFISSYAQAEDQAVLIRLGGEVVKVDQSAKPPESTASKISIDVVQADIHNVIRLFATHTGQNFVIGDGVEGKVTVSIENVPWDQALQAILWSHGLVAISLGEVTIISTLE